MKTNSSEVEIKILYILKLVNIKLGDNDKTMSSQIYLRDYNKFWNQDT